MNPGSTPTSGVGAEIGRVAFWERTPPPPRRAGWGPNGDPLPPDKWGGAGIGRVAFWERTPLPPRRAGWGGPNGDPLPPGNQSRFRPESGVEPTNLGKRKPLLRLLCLVSVKMIGWRLEMGSKQRGGTTLVEVLVAIFIMAIGLMTLLTLFPLGALSMAQALQDSRAGQAAANAAALAEAKQLRHDDKVVYDKDPNASGGQRDVFVDPLPRGNKGTPNKKLPPIPIDSGNLDPSFPSYPVFVDPFGFILTAHPDRNGVTIGDPIGSSELGNNAGIPRRTTRYVYGSEAMPNSQPTQLRWAYRFHSLLDD